ncbi:MAG: hypothetical protein QME51_01210 [Planctomycetota bacterium]|nr:hypothetical protein [Planctomycetota bacterium]
MKNIHIYIIILNLVCVGLLGGCTATSKVAKPQVDVPHGEVVKESSPPPLEEDLSKAITQEEISKVLEKLESAKSVDKEKRKILAENYYEVGLKLYQELRFTESIDVLTKVLELNPDHEKAAVLLEEARLAHGEYLSGEMGTVSRKLFAEVRAKIQQAKLEVEYHLNKGIQYYNNEDYTKAEEEFRWVIETIKWFPYRVDLMNYQTQAENYLKTTVRKKEEKEREMTRRRESAAKKLAIQEEEKRKEDFVTNIDMLFRQSQIEFERENYQETVRLCDKIREKSPGNFVAERLRMIALTAYRYKKRKVTTNTLIEEWKRTFESYDLKTLPYLDPVTFPEKEVWEKVERRGPKKIFKEKLVSELDKQTELLLRRKIKFPFTEATPLKQIIDYIKEFIPNLNIIIDTSAGVDPQESITYPSPEIPLAYVLKDILLTKQWGYYIRDGIVYISTLEKITKEQMETRWYSILDLTIPIIDFPSTELAFGITPEAGDTGVVNMPTISGEELVQLIKETTAKQEGGWEEATGANVAFQGNTGVLVVNHVPQVHKQIETLLNQIRAAADVVVTIEARFLSVQHNLLEDVGVELKGLGRTLPTYFLTPPPDGPAFSDLSAGIVGVYRKNRQNLVARLENFITNADPYARFIRDERVSPVGGAALTYSVLGETQYRALLTAIQKDIRTTEVFAPKITIANGQRAHIQMTDQFTYIKDYDVVIVNAGSSIAMGEPLVDTFRVGVILDVRPIVSTDLKYIMLELRPTLATSETRLPTIRTIPFLIGNINTETQEIELPEIRVQRARGNAIIPDGGILLMSGYSAGKDVNASTGVPVLSKIPLLSFMFGRKAEAEARRIFIILIKAKITILSEEEKKIF